MELNECVMPDQPVLSSEPPPESENDSRRRVRIRITLYFDGTGNNLTNTATRLKGERGEDPRGIYRRILDSDTWQESSYFNDFSNVARLYSMAKESPGYDYHFIVYTEGIGTLDDQEDDPIGRAAGQKLVPGLPDTGVAAKVAKGLASAMEELTTTYPPSGFALEHVTFDTFGFSRGSAAARYCVHRILYDVPTYTQHLGKVPSFRQRLVQAGYELGELEIQAVGLFDTVSAFGVAYTDTSDVRTLYLDAIKEAKAVYQLAAAEEYRFCFSLTNIDSAVSAGKGCQVFLPGAHSDIGGGYVHEAGEHKIVWTEDGCESIQEFLEDYGWAKADQTRIVRWDSLERLRDVRPERPDGEGRSYRFDRMHVAWVEKYLKLDRSRISNRYSFIPLQLMAEFAREQELVYDPALETDFNPIVDDARTRSGAVPAQIVARIKAYAGRVKQTRDSLPEDWMQHDASAKLLRNRYLHFSSTSALGLNLRARQLGEARDPWRRIWSDNA